jgi:serine/threonine protein kinase/formylglycine-generating enzyme required for sulfatase activity
MPLKTWGDFEINFERLLGRGGMGAVYLGRQISLDRPSAVKILKQDLTSNPEFVKRFQREAALLARLVDNHVVQIFGAGEAEGHHYYAMEYIEGEDYASMVRKGHKFTMEEVLKVGESVGLALQAAWRHRIIHRDIKPSNILLTKDQETKVMDFGLAKNPESDLTQSEVIMGTAKYMSPEQATGGACDIRSDLYALGVVLYEFAAGQPPFVGEGATAIMYQHVHKKPTPPRQHNPEIPELIEKMILRLMEKDPDARYATPEVLVAAIRGIREGVTPDEKSTLYNETIRVPEKDKVTEKRPSTVKTLPLQPPSKLPLAASLLAAALVVGVGGYFGWQAIQKDPPPLPPEKPLVDSPPPKDPDPNPKLPDPPPKDPDPPVKPNNPPPGRAWEEPRKKGLDAFVERKWFMAYTQLEEAEKLGATDVAEKKVRARANEQIEKGEAETDEESALRHFEAAKRIIDDDNVRGLIRETSFRRWRKSAEKNEGKDWSRAADDWKRAIEFAGETEIEDARGSQKFCEKFSDAVKAKIGRNWKRALELYQELAANPRGQGSTIETEIKNAELQLKLGAEMAEKEALKDYKDLVDQAQLRLKRAAWAEAKALYDRASDAKFRAIPKDEVQKGMAIVSEALAAPAGMIYVPAGKFTMGGGRSVEEPLGETETVAFYIDEREVTAAEYAEFLAVLDSFGHTPACPKEEPPNKKHFPLDWEGQKGTDSVTGVDFWDATAYARWRKKRLPRESEWEKAAGFDPLGRRIYPWGPKYQKEGGKSFLGLEGMGSGVVEWTADPYVKYPWSTGGDSDFSERKRVLRGGVRLAEDAQEHLKVTYRHAYPTSQRSSRVGFRCVQDVPEK